MWVIVVLCLLEMVLIMLSLSSFVYCDMISLMLLVVVCSRIVLFGVNVWMWCSR